MPPEKVRKPAADAEAAHAALSLAGADIPDALDFAGFADTMASLASTVCIAAAADGEERYGRTVTAVTSLSPQPPTLLVSITTGSDLARLIERTGRFSINLLAEGQEAVGDAFAGKSEVTDRFSIGRWDKWPSGQPRLMGAKTAIECTLTGSVTLDTRRVFIGVLVGAQTTGAAPLLWYDRGYRTLAEKP